MAAWLCSSISSGLRPAVLVPRRGSGAASRRPGLPPQENTSFSRRAHADQLVVDQVGRHADQRQVLAALADRLVAGGERDQVGEALEGDRVAVADDLLDGLREAGSWPWRSEKWGCQRPLVMAAARPWQARNHPRRAPCRRVSVGRIFIGSPQISYAPNLSRSAVGEMCRQHRYRRHEVRVPRNCVINSP